ncbi:MAG TPA: hypothetical protein VFH85_01395 [Gammaproteobacteria bacterium]|nr:hypothetical protein [Gammaproteobacteria bacterium]
MAEKTESRLSGSGKDVDGRIAVYVWEQIGGPAVELIPIDRNPARVAYITPDVSTVTTLVFQLTVTDDKGATGSDSVSVTIYPTVRSLAHGSALTQ